MTDPASAVAHVRTLLPGSLISVLVALAATFVATLHGGPQMLYALFFGVACNYLSHEPNTRPGIDLCSRGLLRLGVGLLGARISAEQIAALGWSTAGIVVAAVVSTLMLGQGLARWLGMSRSQGVLSGGAVAICGASAALAIAAVLPRDKDSDRFTLLVVVSVTALSTLAMVFYPPLARALGLSPQLAGLFLGGTIHDVAQVVGAGYTLGPEAGDYATVVKLFRVAMLAVVVVVVSAAFKQEREAAAAATARRTVIKQALVPWFLWMFVVVVFVNSMGWLSAPSQQALSWASRACLVVAITALGMKTSLGQLAQAGWRPFVLLLAETLWMATLVLVAIWLVK